MNAPKERLDANGGIIPSDRCPICAYEFDAASGMTHDARPKPGDVSLCIKCGEVLEFASDMRVRQASLETMLSLPDDAKAQVDKMQKIIRKERLKG
jgi:hypothetical protein